MRDLASILDRLNCILCGAAGAARSGYWAQWIEPSGRQSLYAVCAACRAINGGWRSQDLLMAVEERILKLRMAGVPAKLSELIGDNDA